MVVVAFASGCGGSSGGSGTDSSSANGAQSAPAATATLSTRKVPGYGTVLVRQGGKPLFLHTADPAGGSACDGACTKDWPPLTVTGAPTAGPGVQADLVGTTKRKDGTTQVTYAQHALYGGGGVADAGAESNGGTWYLVAPSGKAIKTTEVGGY